MDTPLSYTSRPSLFQESRRCTLLQLIFQWHCVNQLIITRTIQEVEEGTIDLSQCTCDRVEGIAGHKWVFRFETLEKVAPQINTNPEFIPCRIDHTARKMHVFETETEKELPEWVDAIRNVINGKKPAAPSKSSTDKFTRKRSNSGGSSIKPSPKVAYS